MNEKRVPRAFVAGTLHIVHCDYQMRDLLPPRPSSYAFRLPQHDRSVADQPIPAIFMGAVFTFLFTFALQ